LVSKSNHLILVCLLAKTERQTLKSIPDAYLNIITPLIQTARGILEEGRPLAGIAFVGSFESNTAVPVVLDMGKEADKDNSAKLIKLAAEFQNADYIFLMMEAWSLRKDKVHRMKEIYERYGSIAASPYAVDIVSMSLETRHGVWMAQVPIKPKGISKKKRTMGTPEFQLFTEAQGRFVDLLPMKDGAKAAGTLH